MQLSSREFILQEKKAITLLGMSGVGKTRLACLLRQKHWFHYSVDYRIGTRYLGEQILDSIKQQLMHIPVVRNLLRSDSLRLGNNIEIDNLYPIAAFLGKLGNPMLGGLGLGEFRRRQALHHFAEIAALQDVPDFISKARNIYGYKHFINDASGSLCELDNDNVLEILSEHTLILYIKASAHDEEKLIQRAQQAPKPLYYRESFLQDKLSEYMAEKELEYVALIEPDDFVCWVFPHLFYSRIPRYDAIAEKYGYTITTEEVAAVKNEQDCLKLIENALQRSGVG